MPEYLTDPCEPNSYYIIELPKTQRKGAGGEVETSYYRAPERRIRGPLTAENALTEHRKMFDAEPKLAKECAIWFSGNVAG